MGERSHQSLIYNVSLQHPDQPYRDELFAHDWINPVVSLDDAIRATVNEDDVIVGDPTDFKVDKNASKSFDWGWDLDQW